ncbi:MAG: cyclic-phosphate processing receiver domain-containing protein [Mycobacteriales bacterium]
MNEAIMLLELHDCTYASLDHDLGDYAEDGGDGYRLVLWMVEPDRWPGNGIRVHSATRRRAGSLRVVWSEDRASQGVARRLFAAALRAVTVWSAGGRSRVVGVLGDLGDPLVCRPAQRRRIHGDVKDGWCVDPSAWRPPRRSELHV